MNSSNHSIVLTRPDILLRLEGLFVLIASCAGYHVLYAGRWRLFAILFLLPDVAILAYLGSNKRLAAAAYNATHTYVFPIILALTAWNMGLFVGGQIAVIWAAHIGFDRILGYGLKFPKSFGFTHIQRCAAPE